MVHLYDTAYQMTDLLHGQMAKRPDSSSVSKLRVSVCVCVCVCVCAFAAVCFPPLLKGTARGGEAKECHLLAESSNTQDL